MVPYYDEGGITIFHADCRDVLPTVAAGSVDLVCVDPPYGTTQLDWDTPLSWPELWPLVYATCRSAAVQAVFSAQPFTSDLIASNRMYFRYELIWPKPMPTGFLDANRRPLRAHENIVIFAQTFGGSTYNPQKIPCSPRETRVKSHHGRKADHYGAFATMPTGVYTDRYPISVLPGFSNGHKGSSDHPTAKPLDLMQWLVLTYSNPGDLVLDFCGGVGTTARACKDLGRRCILVEQKEAYCEIAARRLSQEVFDLA
jgi:site-specific DNA-methyltransferase (adenine-specific)